MSFSEQPSSPPPAEIPEARWQELVARWNKILGLEAQIDSTRISLESVRSEMEASLSKTLTGDDKLYCANADVAQWTKAKSRVHFALPRVREFIHRATWAVGAPERKKLLELFKEAKSPQLPLPQITQVAEESEILLKNRQVLTAQGVSVSQEAKAIAAEVKGALRTLQSNAAAKATKKRATGARGKAR
jgi:hypothetical protein